MPSLGTVVTVKLRYETPYRLNFADKSIQLQIEVSYIPPRPLPVLSDMLFIRTREDQSSLQYLGYSHACRMHNI